VITKKKYTCTHRNCESGLAIIIYKHAAHSLVQHTRCTEVIEMAWADNSTLAISIALLWSGELVQQACHDRSVWLLHAHGSSTLQDESPLKWHSHCLLWHAQRDVAIQRSVHVTSD